MENGAETCEVMFNPSPVPCHCVSILGATDTGCDFLQCSCANLVGEIFRICTPHGFGTGRPVQKNLQCPCTAVAHDFFFKRFFFSFSGNVWLFRQNLKFFQLW